MKVLICQLFGPMAAWGEEAVGQVRPTAAHPTVSALTGLLGAALGIRRDDADRCATLAESYLFAIEAWTNGQSEWDFQTVQTPRQATVRTAGGVRSRRDALALDSYTFTSTREHRTEAYWRVAVIARPNAGYTLDALAEALRAPHFTPYLGRRACAFALPLDPIVVDAETILAALRAHPPRFIRAAHPGHRWFRRHVKKPVTLHWDADLDSATVGLAPHQTIERRDAVGSRTRWQFQPRREHRASLQGKEP